ncbi:MAG: sugar kinase [Betaproteobacteria bacterium]|nr:MAG: sugar kinase [Betaproteobacteria bacterium]
MNDGPEIVALGEPLVEFNQIHAGDPHTYLQGFGGDTSNMAIAAARLGAQAGYITRVGDDAFGKMFIALWRHERVDTRGVAIDRSAPTGIYFVTHGDRGHAFSYLRAGSAASRLTPAELPLDVIRNARVIHVSAITQAISASACDAAFASFEAARAAGVKVSYDTNLRLSLWPIARARATIVASLACCDWCLPSLDDARGLFDSGDNDAIVATCHEAGAPVVVLKCGSQGCVVSNGDRRETVAGHDVRDVDATGAGDCFDGAFAARIVAGDDPFAAARYANAAAALATTGFGAVAPLPRDADVRALLERRS